MKTFAIENDAHVFLYNLDKMFYKVENDKNLGVFIDTYWRATKDDPDAADYIYNDLIDSVPEEMREARKKKIRSKLDDKLKEEQGVESVKDLTERAMLPEEKAHYDKIVGASEKSAAWKRATGDERSEYRKTVYNYIVSGEKAEDVQAVKTGVTLIFEKLLKLLHQEGLEKMTQAAAFFKGTHNFDAFMSVGSKIEDTKRTVYESRVERNGDLIEFTVSADGFLYNMVRIMVGTLLCVEAGRIKPEEIPSIILSKKRDRAGFTAKAEGLYLKKIIYNS
jgi:tRNA pseudouridine(38-40) synthase